MTDEQFSREAVSHFEKKTEAGSKAEREFNPLREGRLFLPLPVVVARSGLLNDREKLAYAALLRRKGTTGGCYASQQTLARDTGKSLTSVKAALVGLRRKGLIRTKRRGKTQTNEYMFLRHPLFNQSDTVARDSPESDYHPAESDSPETDHHCPRDSPKADSVTARNPTTEETSEEYLDTEEGSKPMSDSPISDHHRNGGRHWRRWAFAMRDSSLFPMLSVEDERRIEAEVLNPSPSHVTDARLTEILMSRIAEKTRSTISDPVIFTQTMMGYIGAPSQ